MGTSGAGKTTPLDVMAGYKTGRTISGQTFISPHVSAVAVPVSEGDESLRVPEVPAALVDPNTLSKGVPVCALSAFIGWLESTDSPVQEFGISNASLEEVFLAVTKNAAPGAQHNSKTHTG